MNRRDLLMLLPLARVCRATEYRDYSVCLPDYLKRLAAEAGEKRAARLAALRIPEQIREYQAFVRRTFWELTGGRPESTPLHLRTTGNFERERYRVEKVVFESQPEFHIPGLFYIPRHGTPPYPGVLFQMGHALNGKAYGAYQKCCQGLAQLGYVVLAFDSMGQGERVYYPRGGGSATRLRSADDEHTYPGRQMLLVGQTATRLQTWDAIRALDVLASHALVDPRRLAATGQSGGGTTSMFLCATDERLAAAAICSGNTENFAIPDFNAPGSTDDAEQDFINSGPAHFDRWDLLYPIAPKPLLVLVSAKDAFGTYSPRYMENGRAEFAKLKHVYEILERPDAIAWADTPLPHGLSYELRMHIYNWFERHLQGRSGAVAEEPPVQVEDERALWVSDSGSMVQSFGSRRPFELLAKPRRRRAFLPERELGVERPDTVLRVLSRVRSRQGVIVEAVEVQSAPEVWVPAWLFHPETGAPKRTLLALEPEGRNRNWQEDGIYASLAAEGYRVCVPDLRGVGDMRPEYGRGAAGYNGPHNNEEDYAWASLILGKPLLGQRATDILALVAALGTPVRIAARGKMTIPALIAALLHNRIEQLYLSGGLTSYESIVKSEQYDYPLANFAWNLLAAIDVEQLMAMLAPRTVVIAGPVDGAGNPATVNPQSSNVVVHPPEPWSELRGVLL